MTPTAVLQSIAAALRDLTRRLDDGTGGAPVEAVDEVYRALDDLGSSVRRALPRPASLTEPGSAERAQDLERLPRLIHATVEGAPIGIFHLDRDGRVVTANHEACRSLGYSREELQTLSIYDIDAVLTPEKWEIHNTLTQATGSRTLISAHRRKDGTTFPVEVAVKRFVFDGKTYSMSFVKDITERVDAEQEKAKLEARMLQSQKLESLGVLAGGIAHDFNNLLMVISGNLELALAAIPPPAGGATMLLDADKAAKQAADLCRQLLIYAGKGSSTVEPLDLGLLLREQAKMLEVSTSKSIRLLLNLASDAPKINADVSQMRQVFMNLIINASDAIGSTPGVISITTSTQSYDRHDLDGLGIERPLAPGQYVTVEVSDTGCGMDAAIRERIFDPFFSTKTASRGLGLAAVRGIVNNHGGGIRVSSEPGKGTTFKLIFPVLDAAAPASPAPAAQTRWRGSGWVLLIDDEPALRVLGVRMLERLGLDAMVAANGLEGLAVYKEHRAKIQYVVLDWTMPEMSGDETLRELRRIDPDVRVILASGHAPADVLRRAGPGRVSALVRKPYNVDELARAFQAASCSPLRYTGSPIDSNTLG